MPTHIVTDEGVRRARELRAQYRDMVAAMERDIAAKKRVMGFAMRGNPHVHQDPEVLQAAAEEIVDLERQKDSIAALLSNLT